jgi:hypothetical protein
MFKNINSIIQICSIIIIIVLIYMIPSKKESFTGDYVSDQIKQIFTNIYGSDLNVIFQISDLISDITFPFLVNDQLHLDNNIIMKHNLSVSDNLIMTKPISSNASNININGIDIIKKIYNLIYPVGSFYIQYPDANVSVDNMNALFPSKYAPNSLYGGQWELQWNTESVFFRTEGGNSNENRQSDGIQPDAIKKLTDLWPAFQMNQNRDNILQGIGGVFTNGNRNNITTEGGSGTDTGISYKFDSSIQSNPSDNETRVINKLFRIWKKIAL